MLNKRNLEYIKAYQWIGLGLVLLTYIFMFGHYFAEYIDDAWTLSWAFNFWEKGTVFDPVYGYLDGDGGTALFGRTYVFIYGAFSQIFGWTRGGAYLLSTLFIIASSILWGAILLELGIKKEVIIDFLIVFLLLDPYVGAANRTRMDPLGLLLCSLALLLFIKKRYYFSALSYMIAFENHPMGVSAFLFILAYLFNIRNELKENKRFYLIGAGYFTLGIITGVLYYLFLHYPWLGNVSDLSSRSDGNLFYDYFFYKRMSWRHWPELFIIAFSLFIWFWKKLYKRYSLISLWMISAILCSLLLSRKNAFYIIYLYPPFILMIILSFKNIGRSRLLLVGFLCFQLPQYGYLYYLQYGYNHKQYISEIEKYFSTEDKRFIYGNYNSWFALMDLNFHAYGYFARSGTKVEDFPEQFVLIANPEFYEEHYDEDLEERMQEYEDMSGKRYITSKVADIEWIKGKDVSIIEYRTVSD